MQAPAISLDEQYQEPSRELNQTRGTAEIWKSDWGNHVADSRVHKQKSKSVTASAFLGFQRGKWTRRRSPGTGGGRRVLQEQGVFSHRKLIPLGFRVVSRDLPRGLCQSRYLCRAIFPWQRQGPGFLTGFCSGGRPAAQPSLCLTGRQPDAGPSGQPSCPCSPFLHKNRTADFA